MVHPCEPVFKPLQAKVLACNACSVGATGKLPLLLRRLLQQLLQKNSWRQQHQHMKHVRQSFSLRCSGCAAQHRAI